LEPGRFVELGEFVLGLFEREPSNQTEASQPRPEAALANELHDAIVFEDASDEMAAL